MLSQEKAAHLKARNSTLSGASLAQKGLDHVKHVLIYCILFPPYFFEENN